MFIAAMVLWWEGDRRTVSLTSHFFWGAATEVIEHVGHGGSAEEKSLWAQLAARLHLNVTCETFNIFQLFWWFAPSIETCLWGEHRSCKWLASTSLCRWPWGTRSRGLVMMLWWDWWDRMMFQGLKCLKFDAFCLTNSDMPHLFPNLNPWWHNAKCWQGRAKIEQAISDVYHQDSMYGALHFWGSWMPSKHFPFPMDRSVSTRM